MRFQLQRRLGFTLVELAIAVVILVLLMMLAVPSMNGVLADRQQDQPPNENTLGRINYSSSGD